jgi:hypothetical protein
MGASDVWVAKDDGTELIRAGSIAAVSLDYNGNVTARLVRARWCLAEPEDHWGQA